MTAAKKMIDQHQVLCISVHGKVCNNNLRVITVGNMLVEMPTCNLLRSVKINCAWSGWHKIRGEVGYVPIRSTEVVLSGSCFISFYKCHIIGHIYDLLSFTSLLQISYHQAICSTLFHLPLWFGGLHQFSFIFSC